MAAPDEPGLDARLAEAEAEALRLEADVARRREEALTPSRQRVAALADEVAALERSLERAGVELPRLAQRANQAVARNELAQAMESTPRSPFPGLHWVAGRAVAIAIAGVALVLTGQLCCLAVPLGIGAWWLGRGRRDG